MNENGAAGMQDQEDREDEMQGRAKGGTGDRGQIGVRKYVERVRRHEKTTTLNRATSRRCSTAAPARMR